MDYIEPKTSDELTDRIICILDKTPGLWEQVGAFMECADAALKLPIVIDMFWQIKIKSYAEETSYNYRAELYQGLEWNGQWFQANERLTFSTCTTLPEAICRAWLEWNEGRNEDI